jgi:tetratricopeptide (TPR) repeat protein
LQALALSPNDADVLFYAALIHEFSGRREDALEAYKAALEHGYSMPMADQHPDLRALAGKVSSQ